MGIHHDPLDFFLQQLLLFQNFLRIPHNLLLFSHYVVHIEICIWQIRFFRLLLLLIEVFFHLLCLKDEAIDKIDKDLEEVVEEAKEEKEEKVQQEFSIPLLPH